MTTKVIILNDGPNNIRVNRSLLKPHEKSDAYVYSTYALVVTEVGADEAAGLATVQQIRDLLNATS